MHHDSSSENPRVARDATSERWQAALRRALASELSAQQIAGTDEWVVPSASRPGLVHRTDGTSCTCEAVTVGEDAVCVHRAIYRHARGLLNLDAPATISCDACSGGGVLYNRDCARAGWPFPPCDQCQGTGEAPAPTAAAIAA